MALSRIWVSMICVALAFGAASGRGAQLGAAAAQGVQQAVDFCLTVGGMICLWSGVMELMRRCGIAGGLSRLLRPVLRRLFPHAARDVQALDALSMNVSANLLGLGNAATPAGVRAAQAMARGLRRHRQRRAVPAGGAQHGLDPAAAGHDRRRARGGGRCRTVRHSARRMGELTLLGHGGAAGRKGARTHMAVSGLLTLTVPLLLAGVGLCGVLTGTDVFSALTDGARDGLKTVMRIFPALVALLTAVSMLRASGALEALTRLCAPILARLGIPPETAMLLLVRPISGSGALAAASDIIQTYGADSRIGRTAAVMLGSTETTFYVLAVYFGACGIRHSRWAIPAAIVADVTGFVTAAALVRCLWGT